MSRSESTFWTHFDQLRRTLIHCLLVIASGALITLALHQPILSLIVKQAGQDGARIALFGPISGFTLVFKLSIWGGLALTSPIWLYFLFRFALPALYPREKRLILPFFLVSLLFFSLGLLFAHTVTIPLANRFLYAFNSRLAENIWDLSTYLDYSLVLMGAHAIAFEGVVVLFFLVHLRLVSTESLVRHRRKAIILLFILAALFTPPDVVTQLLLALPLYLLYELAVVWSIVRSTRGEGLVSQAR